MAFVPWKDRVTATPHRYKLTEVAPDTYDLTAVPGAISEAGTPVNAENLNAVTAEIANRKIKDLAVRIKAKTPINDRFDVKSWTGLTSFLGNNIWTDGTNIYYSSATSQYVLDVATSTWSIKTWTGLTSFAGNRIWTDGVNIYYSNDTTQYVLDIATSTWSVKSWSGLTNFLGRNIWTDGANIYYSSGSIQYVLDIATSTWSVKTWTGLTSFDGSEIWTDGANIYYSYTTTQYVLDIATSTWSVKSWSGLTSFLGRKIWTDGANIYYSDGATQYVLNVVTSTWSTKTWTGLTSFDGYYIWTDGTNTYYSNDTTHYKFTPKKAISNWGNVQEIVPPYNPNLLINGDFAINQRGASIYTGANTYTVDRWQHGTSFATAEVLSKGVRLTTSTSGNTGANYFLYNQPIEDYAKYAGKTVTATLAYENNTFVNGRINIRCDTNNYSTDTMSTSGIITFTLTLPSSITTSLKFIITGNHTNGTAETIDLLYAKLELGSIATPFVPPLIAEELPKCQRYYFTMGRSTSAYAVWEYSFSTFTGTAFTTVLSLPTTLRIYPTLITTGQFRVNINGVSYPATGVSLTRFSNNQAFVTATIETSLTFNWGQLQSNNDTACNISFDAEIY